MILENAAVSKHFEYYKNQIFKMLHLFEEKNEYAYKHVEKIMRELEQSVNRNLHVSHDKVAIIYNKLDCLYDEMIVFDDDMHPYVKNLVMESIKMIGSIQEDLK
jgi:hypothetical protein